MGDRSVTPSTTSGNDAEDNVDASTFVADAWDLIQFTCASRAQQTVVLAVVMARRTESEARASRYLQMVTKLIRRGIQQLVKVLVRLTCVKRRMRLTHCA